MKTRTALALTLLLTTLGCSKLTLDNYNKISAGMSYEEVTALIGAPEKCDDLMGVRNCVWGDEDESASVSFLGDKVLVYASTNLK